jgi:hypothetical protein
LLKEEQILALVGIAKYIFLERIGKEQLIFPYSPLLDASIETAFANNAVNNQEPSCNSIVSDIETFADGH